MEHVMAVDPGGTVGLAWAPIDLLDLKRSSWPKHVGSQQITRGGDSVWKDPDVATAMKIMARYRELNCGVIVIERWQHRPGVVLKGEWSSAIVQLAMLRFALAHKWSGNRLFEQNSSVTAVMNRSRMEHLGLYVRGQPHALMARRHLLVFLRRVKNGEVTLS